MCFSPKELLIEIGEKRTHIQLGPFHFSLVNRRWKQQSKERVSQQRGEEQQQQQQKKRSSKRRNSVKKAQTPHLYYPLSSFFFFCDTCSARYSIRRTPNKTKKKNGYMHFHWQKTNKQRSSTRDEQTAQRQVHTHTHTHTNRALASPPAAHSFFLVKTNRPSPSHATWTGR